MAERPRPAGAGRYSAAGWPDRPRPRQVRNKMRPLLRPTAFVDSPFGHDGKVARLAGGLSWFASVELLKLDDFDRRISSDLLPVEGIESRFDQDMATQWSALTDIRSPLQL